jgi:glucosamine-6-phosphate deaminase
LEVRAFPERAGAERALAREIAELVRSGRCVLGLCTGRSPLGLYAELVRLHREEGLSFARAEAFQLDEFEGIPAGHPAAFRRFLEERFFQRVDFDPACVRFLSGEGSAEDVCRAYEEAIEAAGGIDLQLLGLGWNGHIGFNEPGSPRASRTRRVALEPGSRAACEASLGVAAPTHARTLGIATILAARRVRLIAFGREKAPLVAALLSGAGSTLPAASLLEHPDAVLVLDEAAASLQPKGTR